MDEREMTEGPIEIENRVSTAIGERYLQPNATTLELARAALAAMPEPWRPISVTESLPEPNSRVLGWCVFPMGQEWRECKFNQTHFWAYGVTQKVKYWIPLPAPPKDPT